MSKLGLVSFGLPLLVILGVGASMSYGFHAKYQSDLRTAERAFVQESQERSSAVAALVHDTFREMYQGLRTVARLPGVREIDRYGTNFTVEDRVVVQEIYNNLASAVAMSEVYLVPVDFDPDAIDPRTGRLQRAIATFDQLIVGRTAEGPSDEISSAVAEIEIHEWRLMRQQIHWLESTWPSLDSVEGLDYPAIGGPEVITCDNSRFSPSRPDDRHRSGLVYSVPFYSMDGQLKGLVSGVILSLALAELLPSANFFLVHPRHQYVVSPSQDGQWMRSRQWAERGIPDPALIYSEAIRVHGPEVDTGWILWSGRPNQELADRPEVIAARQFALLGETLSVVMTFGGIGYLRSVQRTRSNLESAVRKRTYQLSSANRELRNAHERERRFAGDVAHELKAPLSALRTYAQLALRSSNDEMRKEALSRVMAGVDRTARTVEQLLDLARLESHTWTSDSSAELVELVRAVLAELEPLVQRTHIAVRMDFSPVPPVQADATSLHIMLRNVVDNALRYSPAGSTVLIRVYCNENGATCLQVTDSGPGVAPEFRSRIFDRFFRSPGSTQAGSGLGLSIVARIAELHRIRISIGAADKGEQPGMQVLFEFPAYLQHS